MSSAAWRADYPAVLGTVWRVAEGGRVAHARLVADGSPIDRAACGAVPARGWRSHDGGRPRCGECRRLVDQEGR